VWKRDSQTRLGWKESARLDQIILRIAVGAIIPAILAPPRVRGALFGPVGAVVWPFLTALTRMRPFRQRYPVTASGFLGGALTSIAEAALALAILAALRAQLSSPDLQVATVHAAAMPRWPWITSGGAN